MLRGVMVGAGSFSKLQLEAYKLVKNAGITALCDRDPERLAQRAGQFGIKNTYTDAEEMLDAEQPDFIDIVVRPEGQQGLVRAAATRGVHVLCQKPFGTSLEDGRVMIDICGTAGVRLMINENFRWQAWFRTLQREIREGKIGEPFTAHINSAARITLPQFNGAGGQGYFAEMPRLIMYEMGVHYFDLMRMLFGEPRSVYARTRSVGQVKGEDTAHVMLDFDQVTATLTQSWAAVSVPGIEKSSDPDWKGEFWGSIKVQGTGGTAVVRPEGVLDIYTDDGSEQYRFPEDTVIPRCLAGAQGHFADCLQSGAPFETAGEEYIKTMAVMYAAYRSADTGKPAVPADLQAGRELIRQTSGSMV